MEKVKGNGSSSQVSRNEPTGRDCCEAESWSVIKETLIRIYTCSPLLPILFADDLASSHIDDFCKILGIAHSCHALQKVDAVIGYVRTSDESYQDNLIKKHRRQTIFNSVNYVNFSRSVA